VPDQPVVVAGALLRTPLHDASGFAVKMRHWRGVPHLARILATGGHLRYRDARAVAEICDRSDVRRTEEIGEPTDDMGVVDAGAASERDRLGAVFSLYFVHLGGDKRQCLIP